MISRFGRKKVGDFLKTKLICLISSTSSNAHIFFNLFQTPQKCFVDSEDDGVHEKSHTGPKMAWSCSPPLDSGMPGGEGEDRFSFYSASMETY
ncbi:hypothetical protein NPIL_509351 [Nephila pilipes]|uniref:Uncharacterized protein n=1 Tax=Nephila pilipes TaxID=299642 RepID=A0A8X6N517_NEPPI|nr:hypothetical protein NPIL_509351 [Nephila pilipes]